MSSFGGDRDPVEVLAEEYLERRRRGETPSIAEYAEKYPVLAGEIRDVFPALELMQEADPGTEELAADSADTVADQDVPQLKDVGDYRILREIGRGGMGIVYEAEQQSLGRRVAVKLLPKSVATDRMALARFRREAQAAARLHHTNIVPVFEVGRDGDTAFYAMQYIQGQALDQVLVELRWMKSRSEKQNGGRLHKPAARTAAISLYQDNRIREDSATAVADDRQPRFCKNSVSSGSAVSVVSSVSTRHTVGSKSDSTPLSANTTRQGVYYRSIAQIGVQVASALEYAHHRGTVHRDIKPSNLILDTDGNVWVADFGLAKFEDDGHTRTGDVVGTLRYMSPERFRGTCDAPSDIYALGATLYELLLLRPAFKASDQLELVDQIATQNPPRIQSVDPRVPADLETIVLKAMEKDPERRYESAAEMRDDLDRFLTDQPIRARKVSSFERLGRWARRNPAVATLTCAVFLLLVVLTIGFGVFALFAEAKGKHERNLKENAINLQYIADMQAAMYEWEKNNVPQMRRILARYRRGTDRADLRRWEWYHLFKLLQTSEHKITHRFPARAYVPGGSLVGFYYMRLALSPQRNLMALDDQNGNVTLWETNTFNKSCTIGQVGEWSTITFSSTGEEVLVVDPTAAELTVYDLKGTILRAISVSSGSKGTIVKAAFDPTRARLALGTAKGAVTIFDWTAQRIVGEFPAIAPVAGKITVLDFSPNGRILAAGNDAGNVSIWDTETHELTAAVQGHPGSLVYDVTFSPDNKLLASAGKDGKVIVWKAATGELVEALGSFPDEARSVVFSPDGTKLAAYCRTLRIHLWEISYRRDTVAFTEQESIRGIIGWGMEFLDDDRIIGIDYRTRERAICDFSKSELERIKVGAADVATVLLSPEEDGLMLVARSSDFPRRVFRWRLACDKTSELVPFRAGFDIGCMAVSSEGTWAIGEKGGARIWLYEDPFGDPHAEPARLNGQSKDASTMAFSEDGSRLLVGFRDGGLVVCRKRTRSPLNWVIDKQWDGRRGSITAGTFHPVDESHIVTGSGYGLVTVWNLEEGPSAEDLLRDAAPVLGGLCISPDGMRLFAFPFNSECCCWDWARRQRVSRPGHQGLAGNPFYLPDGQTIVAQSDGARELRLFDSEVWQTRCCLEGGSSIFTRICVSPDGSVIAAGDRDGTIRLFRRSSKDEVAAAGW